MQTPFVKALLISLGLHIALLVALIVGNFSSPPKPTPTAVAIYTPKPMEPIKAVVVERKVVEQQIQKIKDDKAAKEKAKRDKARKAADEKRRKAAAALKRKKERERKIAEEKRRKKAAEEKARKEREAKRRKKLEDDKRKKKEAERKRKEAEKKRKEREAKAKAEQERLMAEQMAKEMEARQQVRQQQVMSELGKYTALITHIIKSNLISDQATMEGKSCKLNISLSPSGYVISLDVVGGDRVVCDAARNAVTKAGKLPVSEDPEVFEKMRSIDLTVAPEF